ncbi:MAG: DUF1036 domain-containing protein [Alphaproteobacteria bacterium]|nr:DUF1036 domain-containing protein [Alphaproteobacteria bacterium]
MKVSWVAAAGVLASGLLAQSAPASAALKLCNQTSYIVYAAIGAATKTQLDTRGWTRIVPGDCATPILDRLSAPAYFVYAHTSRSHSGPPRAWGGNVPICARDSNFSQHTKLPARGCPGSDFYKMPFALLDRHGANSWTTTFNESPGLRTPRDARRAGIARLLEDLHYRVNVPGERARDLALEDFHKRAHLPADANEAELFAALETEAMKAAAPAGFAVCNYTSRPLVVALGLPAGKGAATRGWWEVAPSACPHLFTEPLKTDRVFLLAEEKGHRPVVSGPVRLCVADGKFDLRTATECKRRGLREAGFAAVDVKGRTGYVANIDESGLSSPTSPRAKSR